MARHRRPPSDSLELLLDTICNTFGGVLFIAILIVILLQLSGEKPVTRETPVAPEELQQLAIRLSGLNAELAGFRKTRSGQEQLLATFAPDETRELVQARNGLLAVRDELRTERGQQAIENAERRARIEKIEAEIRNAEQELQAARRQAQDVQAQLDQERQARVQEARMPVVRSAVFKQEVGVILRYGRLYVWHRYDLAGNRLGLNTDEFVVVEDRGDSLVTTPNPAAGIPLDDRPETRRQLRSRLQQFDRERVYITVVARPDSFGSFRFVRDVLLELGFEYRLIPMTDNAPIVDRGGAGGKVQ